MNPACSGLRTNGSSVVRGADLERKILFSVALTCCAYACWRNTDFPSVTTITNTTSFLGSLKLSNFQIKKKPPHDAILLNSQKISWDG